MRRSSSEEPIRNTTSDTRGTAARTATEAPPRHSPSAWDEPAEILGADEEAEPEPGVLQEWYRYVDSLARPSRRLHEEEEDHEPADGEPRPTDEGDAKESARPWSTSWAPPVPETVVDPEAAFEIVEQLVAADRPPPTPSASASAEWSPSLPDLAVPELTQFIPTLEEAQPESATTEELIARLVPPAPAAVTAPPTAPPVARPSVTPPVPSAGTPPPIVRPPATTSDEPALARFVMPDTPVPARPTPASVPLSPQPPTTPIGRVPASPPTVSSTALVPVAGSDREESPFAEPRRRRADLPPLPPSPQGKGESTLAKDLPGIPEIREQWPRYAERLRGVPASEVAQNSYKTQFKETRAELIERLLDPPLTLEDTARLLGVCPTTVRRYTNRGWLAHYRTQGNQRRFRLSAVLSFLEEHGETSLVDEE